MHACQPDSTISLSALLQRLSTNTASALQAFCPFMP
jgi:hypothetical protein